MQWPPFPQHGMKDGFTRFADHQRELTRCCQCHSEWQIRYPIHLTRGFAGFAQIITGQGRHSVNGKARILPAVVSHLLYLQLEFKSVIMNAGIIEVELQSGNPAKRDRSATARKRNAVFLPK
jgi:hypothetical protein